MSIGKFSKCIGHVAFMVNLEQRKKQECIPAGCILATAVDIHGGSASVHAGICNPLQVWAWRPPGQTPQLPPWVWAWRPPPWYLQGILGYYLQCMLGYHSPPRGQNSWHMHASAEILPCPNFVAGGNNQNATSVNKTTTRLYCSDFSVWLESGSLRKLFTW